MWTTPHPITYVVHHCCASGAPPLKGTHGSMLQIKRSSCIPHKWLIVVLKLSTPLAPSAWGKSPWCYGLDFEMLHRVPPWDHSLRPWLASSRSVQPLQHITHCRSLNDSFTRVVYHGDWLQDATFLVRIVGPIDQGEVSSLSMTTKHYQALSKILDP